MNKMVETHEADRERIEMLAREQDEMNELKRGGFVMEGDSKTSHASFVMGPWGLKHFMNIYDWQEHDDEKLLAVARFFNPALKERPIIDLGSGLLGSVGTSSLFASFAGAKSYTGVDKYCEQYKWDQRTMERTSKFTLEATKLLAEHDARFKEIVNSNLGITCLNEDMLTYLSGQDSQGANILMSGVDLDIVNHEGYLEELANQIARVVPVKGYALGIQSPHLKRLKSRGFERVTEIPGYGGLSDGREGGLTEDIYRRVK